MDGNPFRVTEGSVRDRSATDGPEIDRFARDRSEKGGSARDRSATDESENVFVPNRDIESAKEFETEENHHFVKGLNEASLIASVVDSVDSIDARFPLVIVEE